MLEKLNTQVFSEHLHTKFQLHIPGATTVALELFEVAEKDTSPRVEQFSLMFRGPLTPYYQQGTYTVEHEKLGKFALFFVPIGPDSTGMCYQVIFNRLRPATQSA